MTVPLDMATLSVVFLSYDEAMADAHFAALLEHAPNARRVHGVRGFDAAHRFAGSIAKSDHVVTVDADNRILDPKFFRRRFSFSASERASVISFGARISHNGLVYGNGGIKIWPRVLLRTLRTHETAKDGRTSVDFAGQLPYVQAQGIPSETIVTTSARQAFRAGYREGARLTLANRQLPHEALPDLDPAAALHAHVAKGNFERLRIWCMVGRDVENGAWAIYGARIGCLHSNVERRPMDRLTDHAWLDDFWNRQAFEGAVSEAQLDERLERVGARLNDVLDLGLEEFDAVASADFRSRYVPRRRIGTLGIH